MVLFCAQDRMSCLRTVSSLNLSEVRTKQPKPAFSIVYDPESLIQTIATMPNPPSPISKK